MRKPPPPKASLPRLGQQLLLEDPGVDGVTCKADLGMVKGKV